MSTIQPTHDAQASALSPRGDSASNMQSRTYERGRFYIGPNGFPRFAGSASGVYLADTVQTEIGTSPLDSTSTNIEEAFIYRTNNDEPRAAEAHFYAQYLLKTTDLLQEDTLRSRLDSYFAIWHPLFPFLDGAYLLQCFNNALVMAKLGLGQKQAFEGLKEEEALVLSAIMMAVFSIGGDKETQTLPLLRGTSHATMLAHLILGACQNSTINDLFAVQGLIAIELYLYSTRILRPAMHLSGTITKLCYEAGLHRCPARYPDTFRTASDRDCRRRVFYSAYVLDRLLSAEFGIPLTLNDSDVDTCVPGGKEKHLDGESPPDHPARTPTVDTPASKKRKIDSPQPEVETETARQRLLPAYSLVTIAGVMGRAMETFNKSVKHRSPLDAMNLRTELESWWNDIGLDPDDEPTDDPRQRFSTLFTCLYHQQHISLHRSALSLSPSTPEHAYALQSAIASARTICSTLSKAFLLAAPDDECWWPGYVDMVFFSCLILVYGSKRERAMGMGSSSVRLQRDLQRASRILEAFSKRWNLKSFTRVVDNLIKRIDAERKDPSPVHNPFSIVPTNSVAQPEITPGMLPSDFTFDFDGLFGLNPDTLWAFHQSMPNSPNWPS